MRRKKPGKTLEKAAREIMDSDDFVQHVGNIADHYRREHELDGAARSRAVRQALKTFSRHATALADWLEQAHRNGQSSAEYDALNKIAVGLHGAPHLAQAQSKSVLDWLTQAGKAADRAIASTRSTGERVAPRMAAEALRATFEHHRLKWSTSISKGQPSAPVRLLCAIAKSAGDPALTPADARKSLLESGKAARARASA